MEDVKWGMLSGGGSTREVTHELREVRFVVAIDRESEASLLPSHCEERSCVGYR